MDIREEFPELKSVAYLNNGAISLMPLRSREAMTACLAERSYTGERRMGLRDERELATRAKIARLINASAEDICLVGNTSDGLNIAARGLPLKEGDQILILRHGFPGNAVPWLSLEARGIGVKVVESSFGEDATDKLLAVVDPLAGMATVNQEALNALVGSIQADDPRLRAMLDGLNTGVRTDPEDDEAPVDRAAELQHKWETALGQLWEITGKAGTHRVICGDSTDAATVNRVLAGAKVFEMVTDPPYGVEYDPEWRLKSGLNKPWQVRAEGKVQNDDKVDWSGAYRLFPGNVAYVWHAGRYAADLVVQLRAAGFEIRTQIIWKKTVFVIGRGHYHWQHEPLWYAVRKGSSARWCGDRTQSTIWEIPNMHRTQGNVDDGKTYHSAQKPVECMARPIRNHGAPGDVIYDPFLGSGTTLVAADGLRRLCYGCELDPGYLGVILERAAALGMQPRLAG